MWLIVRVIKMSEKKEIRIACKTADYLDFSELIPFQGRFKLRVDKDIEVLANYIIEQGFTCPFFVWDNDGEYKILDGHGRYLAIDYLKRKGYAIPKLPVVIVDAQNEQDARLKVLELNNMNGQFSKEVLLEYAKELTIDYSDLHIAGLDFSDVMGEFKPTLDEISSNKVTEEDIRKAEEQLEDYRPPVDESKYREVTCPKCNYKFSIGIE